MLTKWLYHLSKYRLILLTLISWLYCAVLFQSFGDFRIGLIATLPFVFIYYHFSKSLFFALFSVFFISSQFLLPAKSYPFEYVSPREIKNNLFPIGLYEMITFSISDLLAIALIPYLLKIFFSRKKNNHADNKWSNLCLLSWMTYGVFSLYSALYRSFNPAFSVNYLLESLKMLIIFAGVAIFAKNILSFKFIYCLLLGLLFFHTTLGGYQIIQGFSERTPITQVQTQDREENTPFYRISGVSSHPNRHALIVTVLLISVIPFIVKKTLIKKHRLFVLILLVLAGLNIIATQSRTIWLILTAISIMEIFRYRQRFPLLSLLQTKTAKYIVAISLIFIVFIIVPRIFISALFFSDYGGAALRSNMIRDGLELLNEAPLAGFGTGATIRALLDNIPNGYIRTFPREIHFAYLQIALESGIPAALAFFFPFLLLIRLWIKNKKRKNNNIILGSSFYSALVILFYFSFQPTYNRIDFITIAFSLALGITAEAHNIISL